MATLVETELLSQCAKLLHDAFGVNPRVSMNIQIGNYFTFNFSNHEKFESHKKLSPSQLRRNENRRINFREWKEEHKVVDEFKSASGDIRHVDTETQTDFIMKDQEIFTDRYLDENQDGPENQDAETQVELFMVDAEVNTGSLKVDTLEDELVLDSNGEMRPNFNETMVEMSVGHDVKTWENILNIIEKKLGLRAVGCPWIANTGRHF